MSKTIYRGIDCEPWDHLDGKYYENVLPTSVCAKYKAIRADSSRGLWWATCRDFTSASELANISWQAGRDDTLLAVYSPYLAEVFDRGGWEEPMAIFLGFDLVSVGEWSLLRALLESEAIPTDEILHFINKSGLLQEASSSCAVEKYYRNRAARNLVEPIADIDSGGVVDLVSVYLLTQDIVSD